MGWFDRTLLALYSLSLMALFLFIALMAAVAKTSPLDWLSVALMHQNVRLTVGAIALIYLLVSLKFFVRSITGRHEPAQAVIQDNALGQVRVTVEALENLVHKVTSQVRGVREVRPRVTCPPEGVVIFVRAAVTPDISIPQVSEEIQARVKDYVAEVAGVNVAGVRILVDSISSDLKPRVQRLN
ncbi:MAG: alkaline shock response membrane anchor protein AmaP [Bacillota bacterium]